MSVSSKVSWFASMLIWLALRARSFSGRLRRTERRLHRSAAEQQPPSGRAPIGCKRLGRRHPASTREPHAEMDIQQS